MCYTGLTAFHLVFDRHMGLAGAVEAATCFSSGVVEHAGVAGDSPVIRISFCFAISTLFMN